MARVFAGLLCGIACTFAVQADDPKPKGRSADELLAEGLAKAKADGKVVFLSFSTRTCGWCKYLDKYHARPAVEKRLAGHLVFVKVALDDNPGGEELYAKYVPKQGGVPAWAFVAADGKVLADSYADKGGSKENVGFPYEPHELAHYEKVLRKALPKLSDADVEELMKELKETGPEKKK